MAEPNNNGHNHAEPIVKIEITFDPDRGQLSYHFENCNYSQLIGYLELTKQYAFHDLMNKQFETSTPSPSPKQD